MANKQKLKTSNYVNHLKTLYKINNMLVSGHGQMQMIGEVLDTLDSELKLCNGTVMLLGPDGNEIVVEAAHNISSRKRTKIKYQIGEGVNGTVLQTGKPMIVPKISEEPLFLDRFKRTQSFDGQRSYICVPVSIEKKTIGTMSVDMPFDEIVSLDEMMQLLSIVASMIANDVKIRRQQTINQQRLEDENIRLRHELENKFRPEHIIGNSKAMRDVYTQIHQVSASDTTVLIRGLSGTGKELVANAIHYSSDRAAGPFVRVNCAALNDNLLESELFGHEEGAFTGATKGRIGRIEQAQGGTLFLDEIGDFSITTQVKLLRVLQERQFEKVGSNKTIKTNARIIVATNKDLEKAVGDGDFRQDFYYRINVFPIFLPSLSDRKNDILLLADYFIEKYSKKTNKNIRRISTPAINMMVAYHWPGNVRELENCIERAVLLSNDDVIHGYHLPPSLQTAESSDTIGTGSMQERVDLFERDIMVDALKQCRGNVTAAAKGLGTTMRVMRYKMHNLGIDKNRYKGNL